MACLCAIVIFFQISLTNSHDSYSIGNDSTVACNDFKYLTTKHLETHGRALSNVATDQHSSTTTEYFISVMSGWVFDIAILL